MSSSSSSLLPAPAEVAVPNALYGRPAVRIGAVFHPQNDLLTFPAPKFADKAQVRGPCHPSK